jgi:hypothetical protein
MKGDGIERLVNAPWVLSTASSKTMARQPSHILFLMARRKETGGSFCVQSP